MSQTIEITIDNQTGEELARIPGAILAYGQWTPDGQEPGMDATSFSVNSCGFMTGCEGRVLYVGPSGTVELYFDNPYIGENHYNATPSGAYRVSLSGSVGNHSKVTYTITREKPPPAPEEQPPAPDEAPPSEPVAEPEPELLGDEDGPDEPPNEAQAPLAVGAGVTLSRKVYLIDFVEEFLNLQEWDPVLLELTENRHGEQHGAPCPGSLPSLADPSVFQACKKPHAQLRAAWRAKVDARVKALVAVDRLEETEAVRKTEADVTLLTDFYSWCGDFVSGVLLKAWQTNGKRTLQPTDLAFLNRESLNNKWECGNKTNNLTMIEDYARTDGGLLVWHEPNSGPYPDYTPSPGDIVLFNRGVTKEHPGGNGNHIAFVAAFNGEDNFVTYDGKSFDDDWLKAPGVTARQGVARTRRPKLGDVLRGWVDTSNLRAAMGYK